MGRDQILVPMNPSEFRVGRMDPGMGRWRHQKASRWLLTSQGNSEVWSASPGLRRVRVEEHVPGVTEPLPVSQLLPSTSYCPALTPALSDLDRGCSWPCWCWTMQPARFPHSHFTALSSLAALHASLLDITSYIFSFLTVHSVSRCHTPGSVLPGDLIGPGLPCLRCPAWHSGSGSAWDTRRLSVVLLDLLIWISWLWRCGGTEGVRHREKGAEVSADGHEALYVGESLVRRLSHMMGSRVDGYQGGSYKNWSELPISF